MSTRKVNVRNIASTAIRNANYERLRGALDNFKEARVHFVDAEASLNPTDISSLRSVDGAIKTLIYTAQELVKKTAVNKNLYNEYNEKLFGFIVDLKHYARIVQRMIEQLQAGKEPKESNTYRDLKARLIALKGMNNSKNISLRNLEERLAKLKSSGGKQRSRGTKKRSSSRRTKKRVIRKRRTTRWHV